MPFSNSNTVLNVLVPELKRNLVGKKYVQSRTSGKKQWEADFTASNSKKELSAESTDIQRLIFIAEAQRCSLTLRQNPGSTKKKNATTFFDLLEGDQIVDITKPSKERLLTIHFSSKRKLHFELFGTKANVWLLDSSGHILEGFRKGTPTMSPEQVDDHDSASIAGPSTTDAETSDQTFDSQQACESWIKTTLPGFPREHLKDLITYHSLDQKTAKELTSWCLDVEARTLATPTFRLLEDGTKTLLADDILPLETHQRFDSVTELLHAGTSQRKGPSKLQEEKERRIKAVQTQIKRKKGSLKNLETAEQTLKRATQQEQFGHLLLANAHRESERTEEGLLCTNTFDEGQEVLIPLKSTYSILENGQDYYQRAKKSRAQAAMYEERYEAIHAELNELEEALSHLEATHDEKSWKAWMQTYDQRLSKESTSRPYRPIIVQGVEIWIGKGARENDACLKLSHKDDWWFHARGVAGSHVYIRHHSLGGQPKPPAALMDAAASLAAWHSKAKGSPVVAVSVTQRKHLQKKKQSAPGEVVVRKEDVLDAEPKSSTEILGTFES